MIPKIQKHQKIAFLLLIISLGWIIYSNSFQNEFVFDDLYVLVNNPVLYDVTHFAKITPENLQKLDIGRRYLGYLTFALNYKFHQLDVYGYHLVNWIIHILNTILVWLLSTELIKLNTRSDNNEKEGARIISMFAALLFLCHPLQTQAVTYVVQRFVSLTTLFYLSSVLFYLKARHNNNKKYFLPFAACAACALIVKEISYSLPLMILLTELLFFKGKLLRNFINIKGLLVFVFAVFAILVTNNQFLKIDIQRDFFTTYESASHDGDIISPKTYYLTQINVAVKYLSLVFYPIGQNLDHDFPAAKGLFEFPTGLNGLLLLAILALAFYFRNHNRLLTYGILWFFIGLSIETLKPLPHVIFEHRVYLPSFGIFLAFTTELYLLSKNRKLFLACLIPILVVFSVLTYQRNEVWRDRIALWSDVIEKSPLKSRGYDNLAAAYLDEGAPDKAIALAEKAVGLDPENWESYNTVGLAYTDKNLIDRAKDAFELGLKMGGANETILNNLGTVYLEQNDLDQAETIFENAVELNADYLEPQLNLSETYFRQGRYQESITISRETTKNHPHQCFGYILLVKSYFGAGEKKGAIQAGTESFQKCEQPDVLITLASHFAVNAQLRIASLLYQKALIIDHDNTAARIELGKIYANQGEYSEALQLWQEGQKLSGSEKLYDELILRVQKLINSSKRK